MKTTTHHLASLENETINKPLSDLEKSATVFRRGKRTATHLCVPGKQAAEPPGSSP